MKDFVSSGEIMKIDEITTWEAFLAVVKHGNFTRAAKALGVPASQVTKRVAKLEVGLGVRLFQRTTRSVSLTDEGKSIFPKIDSILEDLKEAEALFESGENLKGTIKVTCVPFIAHKLLLPTLEKFNSNYPEIHFELDLSEKFSNIIESGIDMAIRIETPKDSELIYRKLAPNNLIFCASPKYLKSNKNKIKKPEDLQHHSLLILGIHHRCRFKKTLLRLGNFIKNKKLTCEDGIFLTRMALANQGVLLRSIWDVQEHLASGELVQVLKNHPLETFGNIHAVIPSKRFLAPRVRTFLDFILEESLSWNELSK